RDLLSSDTTAAGSACPTNTRASLAKRHGNSTSTPCSMRWTPGTQPCSVYLKADGQRQPMQLRIPSASGGSFSTEHIPAEVLFALSTIPRKSRLWLHWSEKVGDATRLPFANSLQALFFSRMPIQNLLPTSTNCSVRRQIRKPRRATGSPYRLG